MPTPMPTLTTSPRMNTRLASLFRALLVAAFLISAAVLISAEPANPEKTGLPIGSKAPAFTLKDQNNRDVSLDTLLKKGPVALVFFRSADW